MSRIHRIRQIASTVLEGNCAVNVAAQVGNRGVSQVRRIDTLGQQREGVEKVQILGVVLESEHRLHFPAANAEPRFEPVVGECPVDGRMPLSQVPEIAIVNLCPQAKLVGYLHRNIRSEVRPSSATLAGMHGQPVVLVGIYESLRGEAVELDLPVKEFEFLRLQ